MRATAPVRRTIAAAAVAVLLAAGCGSEDDPLATDAPPEATTAASPTPSQPPETDPAEDPALARFYDQDLSWEPCVQEFQCATVEVPVNYAEPDGQTIELAITRLRAQGPGERIGSLLSNPGGPGASGVEYMQNAFTIIGEDVRARYDLVGFDPRGVGESAPIDCVSDRQLDVLIRTDVTMEEDADIERYDEVARDFAAACGERSPELLPHIGTDNVARDLDVMRAALGDDELYYLGYSYGTYIGAIYADMFPARVGRLVLDGAVDPTLTNDEINVAQAGGFQLAFDSFVEDCLSNAPCQIGASKGEVSARVAGVFAKADEEPLQTQSGRELTEALAATGVLAGMYSEARWELLRQALVLAMNGDGTGLLLLADAYTERAEDGTYPNNSNEAIYAVNCLDRPGDASIEAIQADVPALQEVSPIFGEFIVWSSLPCHYWPVEPTAAREPTRAPGSKPIVVIGTTRDPATPYEWAQALAGQLEAGVFLSYDGDGHTVYGDGVPCVDEAVETYLLEGEPPEDGTEC